MATRPDIAHARAGADTGARGHGVEAVDGQPFDLVERHLRRPDALQIARGAHRGVLQPGLVEAQQRARRVGAHHSVRTIAKAEARRGGEGDPQVRMGERPAANEPVLRRIAVDHAVDPSEVGIAGTVAAEFGARGLGGLPHAVGRARMAREEARRRFLPPRPGHRLIERGHGSHRLQKTRHRRRIEAAAAQVAHAQHVRLQLLRARIPFHVGAGRELREIGIAVDDHAEQCRAEVRDHAVAVALGAVARRHMADLVGDHAGELRFVVGERHQAARDMDVAAGQGEGVGFGAVEHDEGEGRFGLLGGLLNPPAQIRNVALERRVVVETAQRLHQLGMLLGADAPLFLGRHQGGELFFAGRGIDAASAEPERRGCG